MLTLYHGPTSVCSQKARLGLAEKGLEWESKFVFVRDGDQFDPAYLKLNPNAVVPTLVHDGKVVIESSIIIDYLNETFPERPLMPADTHLRALIRIWLQRALEVHAAVRTISFATSHRERMQALSPAEQAARLDPIPNRAKAAEKRDLVEKGAASVHVDNAVEVLSRAVQDIDAGLADGDWMVGGQFSLADIALVPFIDRLYRLGMDGFWADYPRVTGWYERWRGRDSYATEIEAYQTDDPVKFRAAGLAAWPEIAARLAALRSTSGA